MFTKANIATKFRYRTQEYSIRNGFPEERSVHKDHVGKRSHYWKCILIEHFDCKPGQSLGLFFSHTCFDFFALVVAGIELQLEIKFDSSKFANYVIHTCPERMIVSHTNNSKTRCYHYFDLADLDPVENKFPVTNDFVLPSRVKRLSGVVMHTKYTQDNQLVDFLLPSLLSEDVTTHICAGYNEIEAGVKKIQNIIDAHQVNCIFFPDEMATHIYFKHAEKYGKPLVGNIYTNGGKIIRYDKNKDKLGKHNVDIDKLNNSARQYKINGFFYKDIVYQKLYFSCSAVFDHDTMKIKLKVLNQMIHKHYPNLEIDKIACHGELEAHYALDIFRLQEKNIPNIR